MPEEEKQKNRENFFRNLLEEAIRFTNEENPVGPKLKMPVMPPKEKK